jgi:hypothetical protein
VSAQEDREEAARLEQAGDAAAGAGEPAAFLYRQAQQVLMPTGAQWTDRDEYAGRMEGFQRLQNKLYALGPDGRMRNFISVVRLPEPHAPATEPAPTPAGSAAPAPVLPEARGAAWLPAAPGAWLEPALRRDFGTAAALLRAEPREPVTMGAYASQGYFSEDAGDRAVAAGETASARRHYMHALRSFILYSVFPARGDSEGDGIGLAEQVLAKLEQLGAA